MYFCEVSNLLHEKDPRQIAGGQLKNLPKKCFKN